MTENDVYEALELIAAREPVPLSLIGSRGLALPGLVCKERGWVKQPDRDGPLFTTQEGRKALAAFDACRAHAKRIEEGLHPIGEISASQSVRDDLRKRVLDPGEEYNEEAPTSNLVSEVRARLDEAVNAAVSMIQGYTETAQEYTRLRGGLEVRAMLDDASFVEGENDEGRDTKVAVEVHNKRLTPEERVIEAMTKKIQHLNEVIAVQAESLKNIQTRMPTGENSSFEMKSVMSALEKANEENRALHELIDELFKDQKRGWGATDASLRRSLDSSRAVMRQMTEHYNDAMRACEAKDRTIDDLTAQLSARCQQNTGPKLGENPPSENHELISYIYNHHHRSFRGTRKAAQLGELAYRGHWSDNPNSHSSRSGRMVHLAETTYGAISMWCRDGTRSFEVYLAPVCNPTPQLNDVQLSQLAADCAAAVVVPPEETKP